MTDDGSVEVNDSSEYEAAVVSVQEMEARLAKRLAIRETNLKASQNRPSESFFNSKDSSVKRNTAFIKKLRSLSECNREAMLKEFEPLNFNKYIGEVVNALSDVKFKMNDVLFAVELCSLFHQRYEEFSSTFCTSIKKLFESRKDDKMMNIAKLRIELRYLGEIISHGIFTEKEGLPILTSFISQLIHNDIEKHEYLSIVISFCRHCGDDYAGIIPQKLMFMVEKHDIALPKNNIFSAELRASCRRLLTEYYDSLCNHLLLEHKSLKCIEHRNNNILNTKGELSTEKQEEYAKAVASFQKLSVNTSSFGELLNKDVPALPEDKIEDVDKFKITVENFKDLKNAVDIDFEFSLWDDPDTKAFYRDIPDVTSLLPSHCIKVNPTEKSISTDPEPDETIIEQDVKELENSALDEKEDDEKDVDPVDELLDENLDALDEENSTSGNQDVSLKKVLFDNLIQRLLQCMNRDFIDKAALEFATTGLNTPSNRQKLVKALFTVPRTRLDLLPFYSRLVATINPCAPDVAEKLCNLLKSDFRRHMKKKDQIYLESKIKTVRFLGELTKFQMWSTTDCLNMLKTLLLHFKHHSIDMICALVETVGRYLFHSPESHLRTKVLLEQMMRKKKIYNLDPRQVIMLENAFYWANPPESESIPVEKLPVEFEYVRYLLWKELGKNTLEKVLRQLRKIHWSDPAVKKFACKTLTEVWHVRYNSIQYVASILAGLVAYHEDVGIQVVDNIIEDVRIGLEIQNPKFNQRRVSVVRFLGEMYNFRMIESSVIFKVLYSFITFGQGSIDGPDHLFRIRLTCILLDSCGQYFERGSTKKKLDCFLIYFMRYVWKKKSSSHWSENFPIDIDNMISDTIEILRPDFSFPSSLKEAEDAVNDLITEMKTKLEPYLPVIKEQNNVQMETPQNLTNCELNDISEDYEEEDAQQEADYLDGMDQSAEINGNVNESQEDVDFIREYEKFCSDNLQLRSDINLNSFSNMPGNMSANISFRKKTDQNPADMKLCVMVKKGNRTMFRDLDIPLPEEMASSIQRNVQEEQDEREKLKQKTLSIHERQQEEEHQELISGILQPLSVVNRTPQKQKHFQHPRGAPNADLIFNTGGRRR